MSFAAIYLAVDASSARLDNLILPDRAIPDRLQARTRPLVINHRY